jgi:hypothetical protein
MSATDPALDSTSNAVALDAERFTLLNCIHLKRLASTEQLLVLLNIAQPSLLAALEDAETQGLLMSTSAGHMLLPDGTDAVQRYYRECYESLRTEPVLSQWYTRFEVLNTRFIALLTTWQRDTSDEQALDKALTVVEQLSDALAAITTLVPRYADYQRRFAAAVDAIEGGDKDLLCNPRRDSAHNIWFEFHEDILSVLGRPRETT